jgi:hypothetical protein
MRGEPLYAVPKPAKFASRVKTIKKALARVADEDKEKAAAKIRDGHRCRWPHGRTEKAVCRRMRLDAAHYLAKSLGGANRRENLISFCLEVHEGSKSLHSGDRRVVPLTPDRMDDICAFKEKRGGKWVEVGREIRIGVLA